MKITLEGDSIAKNFRQSSPDIPNNEFSHGDQNLGCVGLMVATG
jgi:hypothetical protein